MFSITKAEFEKLANLIRQNYGINLSEEKITLLTGRLQKLLSRKNLKNFSEYYEYVVADKTGQAATELVDGITTNHTFFMRETDHFFYFRDKILPYLKTNVREKDLRIWSAGCSTGEEPYTLAMIIDGFFGAEKGWWDTKILATDISTNVLEKARRGVFAKEGVVRLPPHWRMNYFQKFGDSHYIISQKIRDEIIFRNFNLMDKVFPFKRKFHVIFCRNVMIYFNVQTKQTLIQKLYDALESGGYLFIGHSESINREESDFKYVIPALYRKE